MNKNNIYSKSFMMMFVGLLVSAFISYLTYSTGLFIDIASRGLFTILTLVELGVVIVFSLCFRKLSPNIVKILYYVYAIINGFSLSTIFYIYQMESIIFIFIMSSLIFLILSIIGKKTDKDLSSYGIYITVFLIGSFILSLLNVFIFKNTMFELILDIVVLLIFGGVTIYDVNKMKYIVSGLDEDKAHIYFAMDLYLDFINIFIRLLSIFGKERD